MAGVKCAEKLILLQDVGVTLLDRLHVFSRALSDPKLRPQWLTDKAYERPIKKLVEKFPDMPLDIDRTPGMDALLQRCRPQYEEIEGWYFTMVDIMEWREAAAGALNETAAVVQVYSFHEVPHVAQSFLDVIVMYVQLLVLLSVTNERREILALFSRLHHAQKTGSEPSYTRVASFVNRYAAPTLQIPEDLRGMSTRFGLAMNALAIDYYKIMDVKTLRKEGTCSLVLDATKMALPSQDSFTYLLGLSGRLFQWITLGTLACPEELGSGEVLPMLKHALSMSFVVPLARDESLYIHNEFDNLFDKTKSKSLKNALKRDKKLTTDSVLNAVGGAGPKAHQQRRTFARQELRSLLSLCRDQPGLLGPKIQLVLTCMGVCRDEVMSYFRHGDRQPPKAVAKNHDPARFQDPHIMEMIYLLTEMTALVQANRMLIQGYYLEYLSGPDLRRCSQMANDLLQRHPNVTPYVQSILAALQSIDLNAFMAGHQYDFRTLRLNWFRVEAELAQTGPSLGPLLPIVTKFALMSRHTRYVDDLDRQVDDHGSVKELYYWRDSISQAFDASLQDGNARFAFGFLRLLALFPLNAFRATPEEAATIGSDCVALAKGAINRITRKITSCMSVLLDHFQAFDAQLAPELAAVPWLAKLKDYKFPKDFVPPVAPGSESEFKSRPKLDALRQAESVLWHLCSALNEAPNIVIYDNVFAPRESVREALFVLLRDYMRRITTVPVAEKEKAPPVAEIERPSVIERRLLACQQAIKTVQSYLDLDLDDMVREVWVSQIYHRSLSGQLLDWAQDSDLELDDVMIKPLVAWYADFIARRTTPAKDHELVFAPNRHGFHSKGTSPFKSERYVDLTELISLCRLVGGYGVRLLDREILRVVLQAVGGLKEIMVANKLLLDEASKSYQVEAKMIDIVRRVKPAEMDLFVQRAITLGLALNLRSLLHEAAGIVVSRSVPYIHSTVRGAFSQYPQNTFSSTDYLPVDLLAADAGIPVGTADHALKAFVRKACAGADAQLWQLLPMQFALAMISSKAFADAEYQPMLDAHRNNVHVLTSAISDLVVSVRSVSGATDESTLATSLLDFVSIASTLLLRMARSPPEKGKVGVASLAIFLDKFISQAPFLTRDRVDRLMPYALVRTLYREVYAPRGRDEVGGDDGPASGAQA